MVRAGICLGLSIFIMLFPPLVTGQSEGLHIIEDIEWHPSDDVLAVAYSNGRIKVVDQTNKTITFQQSVRTPVYEIEWSPDGTRLATSSAEKILVWDVTTGQLVTTLSGSSFSGDIATEAGTAQEAVYDMDWNTANQLASIAISGEFRIWDMDNSQLVVEAFVSQPGDIAWSPDNSHLLTTSGIVIVTIDPINGAQERWQEDGGYSDYASAIVWSADGSKFAIGDGFGRVSIVNDNTGEFIDATPITDIPVTDISWSPDGAIIAATNADGSIQLYNAETLALLQTLLRTNSAVVAWSPDGTKLAFEGRSGDFEVKSLPTANPGTNQTLTDTDNNGSELVTLDGTVSTDPDGTIEHYEWLENGVVIAEGENSQVELGVGEHTITLKVTDNDGLVDMAEVVVEVKSGDGKKNGGSTSLSVHTRWIEHVAWHNEVIAIADTEDIWLYEEITLQQAGFIDRSVGLVDMEWHPNADRLAISGGDGYSIELSVWNMNTRQYDWEIPVNKSYSYSMLPIRWSPDGQFLALGLYEELHIYNGITGNLVQSVPGFGIEAVAGIAWSPSGDKLLTTTVENIQVWDTTTWRLVATLAEDFDFWLIEWINGTSQVAVVNGDDIDIWDTDTLQLVTTLTTNHNNVINSLVWNDIGGLASASYDGVIQIWEVDSGQATNTLTVNNVSSVDWSPDGSQLIYGGRDGLFEVKTLPTANPGPNLTLTDTDNNGRELVTLDATASTDLDGTIEHYEWLENGVVIAEGENPQVELGVGEHSITLKVTDDDGLVDVAEVVTEVEASESSALGDSDSIPTGIISVDWSPDGTMLVSGGTNGLLQVTDASGNLILDITGLSGSISSVNWSPDSNKFAAALVDDQTIRVWNVNDPQYTPGALLATYTGHESFPTAVDWSPDGTRIVSVGPNEVRQVKLWDAVTFQPNPVAEQDTSRPFQVVWSPDSTHIAISCEAGVLVFEKSLNIIPHANSDNHRLGADCSAESVDWSPDGSTIAVGYDDHSIALLDVNTGATLATLQGHTDFVNAVAWNPTGTQLASASQDGTIRVWDAASGTQLTQINKLGNTLATNSIGWNPAGTAFAYGDEAVQPVIKVLPTAKPGITQTLTDTDNNGSELATLDATASTDPDGTIDTYEWLENGVVIAEGANPQVELEVGKHTITLKVTDNDGLVDMAEVVIVVEATTSEQLDDNEPVPTGVISVDWSPDGTMLVSGGTNGLLQVTDPTGNLILNISGLTGTIGSVTWNPDSNKFAATISDHMTVRVWNVNDPQYASGALLATFTGHESIPYSVNWSPDGTLLVSVGFDETREIKLWDVVTFNSIPVAEQGTAMLTNVTWSPDSTRLAVASNTGVLIFEKSLNIFPYAIPDNHRLGPDIPVFALDWSPDGSTIAASYHDYNIRVLDVTSGAALATMQGHSDYINAVAWNPTGTQLASASQDGTIRVWDAASGTQLTQINKLGNTLATNSIGWNPAGTAFAYGDEAAQPVIKALPIADPGPDETFTDTDNDASELVTLDATASTDPDGTIEHYEWLENGVVIAEGENSQVELGVGEHTITLKVTDTDGLVDMAEVVINIQD
jgi:WD40 repeat protein